jgi:nitrate reductase NapE component
MPPVAWADSVRSLVPTPVPFRALVLYAAFMPFITILHAIIDMMLFCRRLLHPLYAAVAALAMCGGWGFMTYLWMLCYVSGPQTDACPAWTSFKGGVSLARLPFAAMLIALYLVYMALAIVVLYRAVIEATSRRRNSAGFTDLGSEVELDSL